MSLKVLVSSFEDQLRLKVQQKTRSTSSPEITLVKCFKYFDLNGNGTVECEEFRKAVEKLGVTFDFTQLTQLFKYYDKDGSGQLDYKEFSSAINGLKSEAPSTSFTPNPTTGGPFTQNNARSVADLLDLLRAKIKQRGATGMFGLQRLFRIMDDDGSKSLNKFEFAKALREYRLDIPHQDVMAMFQAFDMTGDGAVDYDEFVRVVRGPMNQTRVNVVTKAFKKLDKDGSESIDIRDVKGVYDASKHPDVIQGKRTEDDILREFLSTFQSHHTLLQQKHPDARVTLTEFQEYYNNVSASIDNDDYFVTMINNTWKLLEQPAYVGKPAWSADYTRPAPSAYSRAQSDTYSVMSEDTKYSDVSTLSVSIPRPKYQTILLERFRTRLLSRGSRGIIGLKRQFKLMDLDGSGKLSLEEFGKAIQDLRLEIVPQDVKTIFKIFDKNGDGTIDCQEFMTQIVGEMSQLRRDIVTKAFMKLDHYEQGSISLQTIRSEFDASRHPDAKTGKKSPEEVLGEFLEAFQAHHLVTHAYSGGSHQDAEITFPAFLEFYNFISVTIESDAQFDMLLTGVWNLDLKNNVQARAFAGSKSSVYAVSSKQAWLRDHHRSIFAHDNNTASHAPFGVSQADQSQWQSSQQSSLNAGLIQKPSAYQPAGIPTWPNVEGANVTDASLHSTTGRTALTSVTAQQRFKRSLLQRGLRGIIGLKRVFKILDDDDSGYINLDTFRKGLMDYRLQLSEEDPKELFDMGARGDSVINYEQFIKSAIGCMNEARRLLVTQAFDQLDGQGAKQVTVEDIKGSYNPQSHPDIRLGKKTEEEVLAEFIDTFEMHYGILHPGSKSRRVTLNEFLDYYDYVSALTSDDQYFYQLITTTWTPPQVGAQLRVYS